MSIQPLSIIADVYEIALTEEDNITIVDETDKTTKEALTELQEGINEIVDAKRNALGFDAVEPRYLEPKNRLKLNNEIKSDKNWKMTFEHLICLLDENILKKYDAKQLINAFPLADWNNTISVRKDDNYTACDRSLEVVLGISHSYIAQLDNSKKFPEIKTDKPSVNTVTISEDDFIVTGRRAGRRYAGADTIIPTGSIDYSVKSDNILFENFYNEMQEELGLKKDDLEPVTLFGRIEEYTLANGSSQYMFKAKANLAFEEIVGQWINALDNREHTTLIPMLNKPASFLKDLKRRRYNPAYVNQEDVTKITPENHGCLLTPAVAGLLSYGAKECGKRWALGAEGALNNEYKFTCY